MASRFSQELKESKLVVHTHAPGVHTHIPGQEHTCTHEGSPLLSDTSTSHHHAETRVLFMALSLQLVVSVHSVFEGLGLGSERKVSEIFSILLAIVVHKGVESFVIASAYIRSTLSRRTIVWLMVLFACMTPLGIAGGILISTKDEEAVRILRGFLVSLAAGTFLYVFWLAFHSNCAKLVYCDADTWERSSSRTRTM